MSIDSELFDVDVLVVELFVVLLFSFYFASFFNYCSNCFRYAIILLRLSITGKQIILSVNT